jgi:hypothetical protein
MVLALQLPPVVQMVVNLIGLAAGVVTLIFAIGYPPAAWGVVVALFTAYVGTVHYGFWGTAAGVVLGALLGGIPASIAFMIEYSYIERKRSKYMASLKGESPSLAVLTRLEGPHSMVIPRFHALGITFCVGAAELLLLAGMAAALDSKMPELGLMAVLNGL